MVATQVFGLPCLRYVAATVIVVLDFEWIASLVKYGSRLGICFLRGGQCTHAGTVYSTPRSEGASRNAAKLISAHGIIPEIHPLFVAQHQRSPKNLRTGLRIYCGACKKRHSVFRLEKEGGWGVKVRMMMELFPTRFGPYEHCVRLHVALPLLLRIIDVHYDQSFGRDDNSLSSVLRPAVPVVRLLVLSNEAFIMNVEVLLLLHMYISVYQALHFCALRLRQCFACEESKNR
jgi:hypothetical protein